MSTHSAGTQHFAFGLKISANVEVPGLAPCEFSGPPDIVIRLGQSCADRQHSEGFAEAPIGNWIDLEPRGDIRIRSNDRAIAIRFRDRTEFIVSKSGSSIWGDWPEPLTLEDATTYLLGPVISLVLRLRGIISLHASAVRIGNFCVAVVGPQGAGKSTTAASFATAGYPVLTDDLAPIDDRGDRFNIIPSYPGVRLWDSSVEMLFGAGSTLPRITPTWDKRYLGLGKDGYRFQSEPVPLAAIYFLHPRLDASSAPSIDEEPARDGLIKLIGNIGANYVLDQAQPAATFDLLQRISRRVPLRRLVPSTDPERLSRMRDMVVADANALQVCQVRRQEHV